LEIFNTYSMFKATILFIYF